jgi:hypothetical protein
MLPEYHIFDMPVTDEEDEILSVLLCAYWFSRDRDALLKRFMDWAQQERDNARV